MSVAEIVITVVACVVGVPIGMFFGFIPLRTYQQTERQSKASQTLGVIGVGLVVVLIFTKHDPASWAAMFAMLAGVLVARIPPLHRAVLERFPWLKPVDPKAPRSSKSPKTSKEPSKSPTSKRGGRRG